VRRIKEEKAARPTKGKVQQEEWRRSSMEEQRNTVTKECHKKQGY